MTAPEKQRTITPRLSTERTTSRIADWVSFRFDNPAAKPTLGNVMNNHFADQIARQLHCVHRELRPAKTPEPPTIREGHRSSGSSLLSNWLDFRDQTGVHIEDKAPHRDFFSDPRM